MKWLEGWRESWRNAAGEIKNALWKPVKSWTLGWLEPNQLPDNFKGRNLEERKDYVEIRLKSMRIPYESVGARRFYGTVHSFISLDTLTSGRATFNVVTTPSQLQNVDARNLNNVIPSDLLLLGPVPYQGGDISIEAGVFSVLSDNLIAPFLKVIEDVSKTAGVSIVSQAIPFVQPIENAIYHLINYDQSNKLEIGISMPLMGGSVKEGYLVAVGASPDADFLSTLKLQSDGRLFAGKEEIKKIPYMVLTVRAKKRRISYTIPDIKTALANLITALGKGEKDIILKYFADFKNVVYGSPDLLPEDADMIIDETFKERVKPVLDRLEKPQKIPAQKIQQKPLADAEKFLVELGKKIEFRGID